MVLFNDIATTIKRCSFKKESRTSSQLKKKVNDSSVGKDAACGLANLV